jgi:nicotinate-nucleotide pyrophosphorylase (carboxylating)
MPDSSRDIIDLALAEDIGSGDATVRWFTNAEAKASAKIVTRQDACLAGVDVAAEVFRRVDPTLEISILLQNGHSLQAGDAVLSVSGPAGSILTAERTALNFIQRLSGTATIARAYVNAVAGTGVRILDTRKTTPGMRLLEKNAVAAGGATNHRMGLYDMVMVKDNHLAIGSDASDLQASISRARAENPGIKIEIEADTVEQALRFATLHGVDTILLDNMSLADLRTVVASRPAGIALEASGGVTLSTVRAIAETGVDFISVGAMTHSAPSVDFGLDFATRPDPARSA